MRNPNWTNEETLFLEEKWGTLSVPEIAKKLNRPVGGVINKVSRLGLPSFLECGSYVSLGAIFDLMGLSNSYTTCKKK